MAKRYKTTRFSIQGFDTAHYQTTEQYAALVDELFNRATVEVTNAAAKGTYNPDVPFTFADYPALNGLVQKVGKQLAAKVQAVIEQGSRNQWLFACKKNDGFINSIFDTSKLPKSQLRKMQDRNLDALSTFQGRKVDGMNLSQRVWRTVGQYKIQMESALDVGLGEGRSAQQLARDVKQNLKDPNRLFRRVRDKRGNLQLSKAAQAFHPGQGVYRSSVKNAQRLARTEINMAYRESDWARWQTLDFVVGFEIRRSNHEPKCKCDLCERLVGRYPKTFKFTGWHPQCMCVCVPILMDEETFDQNELADLKAALHGKEYQKQTAKNQVNDVPDGFKEWVQDHIEAQGNWGSTPYFIRDNFINGDLSKGLKQEALQTKAIQTPKVDPVQQQIDVMLPQITAIKQDASDWGLNTYPIDEPLAKRDIPGIQKGISEMQTRIARKQAEKDSFVSEANQAIKDAKKLKIDFTDVDNAVAMLTGGDVWDKRNWSMNENAFKTKLKALKDAILSKQVGNYEPITTPTMKYVKPSSKQSKVDQWREFCDAVERTYPETHSMVRWVRASRQSGMQSEWAAQSYLKAGKRYNTPEDRAVYATVNKLEELKVLKQAELDKIPVAWRKSYNDAIKKINAYDTKDGVLSVYNEIEHAYNIYKLTTNKDAIAFGLDKISDKMPVQTFAIAKKIPGFLDKMPTKEFWESLERFIPLLTKGSGAYHSPTYRHVCISMTDEDNVRRMTDSDWFKSGLVHHEFGHAQDHSMKWRSDKDFMDVYASFKAEMTKDDITTKLTEYIKNKGGVWKLTQDEKEKLGALSDCLQAATPGHKYISPGGHSAGYFASTDKQMAEFIAHMSENYWSGNDLFKLLAPETYKKMRELLKNRWK